MTMETCQGIATIHPKTVKALGWREMKKGIWVKIGKKYDLDFNTNSTKKAKYSKKVR